jgi:N-acyl-D-amino-acid deacylase
VSSDRFTESRARSRGCPLRLVLLLGGSLAGFTPAGRAGEEPGEPFDVVIRGGTIYDGSGSAPYRGDLAIRGERIAAVGGIPEARGRLEVKAEGLAVAPGFINMLSWSNESLIEDGRSQSEVRQGVTTQVLGEGESMGPLTESMKERLKAAQTNIHYPIEWTTLREYLLFLERRGISQNVTSFIGATTIREHVIGLADRKATPGELERMRALVEREMEDGALGIGSSLVYAPAFYAPTEELIELCRAAARHGGRYISHLRSEGADLLGSIDELIRISREAGLPAEIYHFKAAGQASWPKMDAAIKKVEEARRQGLAITADMYCYTAGATGLDASIPPWAHDGGPEALQKRLRDPAARARIAAEIRGRTEGWENFYLAAGSPERILLVHFAKEELKPLTGKTLAEAAQVRGQDPVETLMDLVLLDESRIGAVYFMMSEENVRKLVPLPWVSFGSDAESQAPEGVFLKGSTHPRAYGNFARLLGKYVREERLLSLAAAVRKLTGLPAANLGLAGRGLLKEGYFADLVVFDPRTIQDRADYRHPQEYAVGVKEVYVNGVAVLKDGIHTGARPGRALRGPGKRAP